MDQTCRTSHLSQYQHLKGHKIEFVSSESYVRSVTESSLGIHVASFATIQNGRSGILKSPFRPDSKYFFFPKKILRISILDYIF